MSLFRSELLLRDNTDGKHFTLIGPLHYSSDLLTRDVYVPGGFITDFASIPRGLWNVLPKIGKYDRAAVIHDFLYVTDGMTRRLADAVLWEACAVCGVSLWQQRVIYWGVRLGGWRTWNRYRAAQRWTLR